METEQYALAAFVVGNGVHSDTLHDECKADTFAAKFLGATVSYDAAEVGRYRSNRPLEIDALRERLSAEIDARQPCWIVHTE